MSFPYHDRFWCDAADFLEARAARRDLILAPDIFWWRFRKIYRYVNTRLRPDFQYDWIVLHKGLIDELPALFIVEAFSALTPLFANEVFVILGRGKPGDAVGAADPHLASFTERLPSLVRESRQRSSPPAAQPVLPEPGAIFKFSALEAAEFAEAMDQFWLNGGYIYPTLRDKTYYAEIDRYIAEFIGNGQGQTILDLCCGAGRLSAIMSPQARVIGVDISGVAIGMAEERYRGKSNFNFRQMDAHALAFPDESFDVVLFIDAIEHVMDADRVFAEIRRVLKSDGLRNGNSGKSRQCQPDLDDEAGLSGIRNKLSTCERIFVQGDARPARPTWIRARPNRRNFSVSVLGRSRCGRGRAEDHRRRSGIR